MDYKKTLFIFTVSLLASLFGITGYEIVWDEDHPQEQVSEFEPITFAEVNARPARTCEVTYQIEADVILSYVLDLHPENSAAPCNCTGAVPLPYHLETKVTVNDLGYTPDELLALVKLPAHLQKRFLIGEWHNVELKYKGRKNCPEDKPEKDEPSEPVQG